MGEGRGGAIKVRRQEKLRGNQGPGEDQEKERRRGPVQEKNVKTKMES